MASDKLFRVIVLGGVALVGGSRCSSATAAGDAADTGNAQETGSMDGPGPDNVFPAELPTFIDSGLRPDAAVIDAGSSGDASAGDASSDHCVFPFETALPQDC